MRRYRLSVPAAVLLASLITACGLLLFPAPVQAAVYTVTTTVDTPGAPFPGNPGELRWAINSANVVTPGPDQITFAIPPGGVQTITPLAALPTIVDPVTIDGTTQIGGAGIGIQLDGVAAGGVSGLVFQAGSNPSQVTGLAIYRFSTGIDLNFPGGPVATNITINGNNIGTDASGTASGLGNTFHGINLVRADSNTIGGAAASDRNVVSGNGSNGIRLYYSSNNAIKGNYVGLDATGAAGLGNTSSGVYLEEQSDSNTIGGTTADERNVISGNGGSGVAINSNSDSNVVEGDYIGTNASGTAAIPNLGSGVNIFNGSNSNTVGGTTDAERNIISCNGYAGILVSAPNGITGNYIGTDVTGTIDLGNQYGVYILGGSNITIGGPTAAERNIISGNNSYGVFLQGASATGNSVQGNYIGTDKNGTAAIGNNWGVYLEGNPSGNTIGGTTAGERNVISGNYSNGIRIWNAAGNTIEGNHIGVDATGTAALGNGSDTGDPDRDGIYIYGGSNNNTIGGDTAGERNVISANGASGIRVNGCTGTSITGNYIGTDTAGTADLGNTQDGVYLYDNANNNTIGGTTAGERNVISGNNTSGISVAWSSTGNSIQGNYIGTDAGGTLGRGNSGAGVYLDNNSNTNTIGGTVAGAGNVISGNNDSGIIVNASTGNSIQGNYIGTDKNGTGDLGNGYQGILLNGGSSNTIGGTTVGARNIISGNTYDGVRMGSSTGNNVQGNYIGTDVTGTSALHNYMGMRLTNNANSNTIGGTTVEHRNVVSGNTLDGIYIENSTGNSIQGNYLGTDAAGTTAVANGGHGVCLYTSANSNTVGGTSAAERNVISGNDYGVHIAAATGNVVSGNYIGTDSGGTASVPNNYGVYIYNSANNNTIGGTTAGHRNIISGNNQSGVRIDQSTGNNILGNYVGTDVNGTADLGNVKHGVYLTYCGSANTIGGTEAGSLNVISGNGNHGINAYWCTGQVIQGNYVGTDASGTVDLGNSGHGVFLDSNANTNTIGGAAAGARNVISGNNQSGVHVAGSTGNTILGNYIGTDVNGTADLGNTNDGVYLLGNPSANTVGGSTPGERNIISGNNRYGVNVEGSASSGQVVSGNYIGTDVSGTLDLGNAANGVTIYTGATGTVIGGDSAGERNVISGNDTYGVFINTSSGNTVSGNYIGTDLNGSAAIANARGVGILAADGNTLGGSTAGERNVISGNSENGIRIEASTGGNIRGNYIGLAADGVTACANSSNGIYLGSSANTNTIGGTAPGAGNVISANDQRGVYVTGSTGNSIQGNYVGLDKNGDADLGNGSQGIAIVAGSNTSTVGGTASGACNVVSGNGDDGVLIRGSNGCTVQGNRVGTNAGGTLDRGNTGNGVLLENGADGNTVGGASAEARNIISGNDDQAGVYITGSTGNTILGNYIGTDKNGAAAVPNSGSGVFLYLCGDKNTIGGDGAGAGNVIAGNALQGVELYGCQNHVVEGNYIGTDATGTTDLGNGDTGVHVCNGSTGNTIGGTTPGARNLISGNNSQGVQVDSGSNGNAVKGNYIGTDASGATSIENHYSGVYIFGSSTGNTIGGTTAGERNLISGNGTEGVHMDEAPGNSVMGNFIGTDVAGTSPLANMQDGIFMANHSDGNTIGGTTPERRNIISGNGWHGIYFDHCTGNPILGNYIGTDANGTAALPNAGDGVFMQNGADNNTIGGTIVAERNIISGDGGNGIDVRGSAGTNIRGNYIGTDKNGTADLGNGANGIYLRGGSTLTTVGGAADRENLIRFNGLSGVCVNGSSTNEVSHNQVKDNTASGVLVEAAAYQNRIHENSIYGNGDLGIKLTGDGNHNYAVPVITSVFWNGASADVTGTATAGAEVELFYTGAVPDPSGSGEGLTFLGTVTATGGTFSTTVTGVALGDRISGVAICPAGDPNVGDTSQFSLNGTVEWPPPEVTSITPRRAQDTGTVTVTDLAGTDFRSGATVKLRKLGQADITATDVDVVSSTKITCLFDVDSECLGAWAVYVENDDAKSDTLPSGFYLYHAGSLDAWGDNSSGQCNTPAGSNFISVAGGESHSVALKIDGSLSAWGSNNYQQCDVPTGTDFAAVEAGGFHCVALKNDGSLDAWGWNDDGQCDVPAGNDFVAVVGGWRHSVALKSDGTLFAWGDDSTHQCEVPAGNDYVAISSGDYWSLALKDDGSLRAWGTDASGQLGVPAGNDFKAIAAGVYHGLALKSDGSIAAWGTNDQGQCNVPPGTFEAIAAGRYHSEALQTDGSLAAWGDDSRGQCQVPAGDVFTSLTSGGYHGVAIANWPAPTVTSLVPNIGNNNATVSITDLAGTDFRSGATVKLTRGGQADINATNVVVVSGSRITCDLDLSGRAVGTWNVVVTNHDGQTGTLTDGFDVQYPPPEVTGISPNNGNRGETLDDAQIAGSEFRDVSLTVELQNGGEVITATDVNWVSGDLITADFTIPVGATVGQVWDVFVMHGDDGKWDALTDGFDVQYPPPVVTGISPNNGNRGQTLTGVQIDGSDFRGPNSNVIAQLKNGADIIDGTVTNVTGTQITCDFTITAGATVGLWDVYVQHVDDGKNDTLAGAFDVQYPPPVVTGISPNNGNRRQTLTGVQINGSDFRGPNANVIAQLKNGADTINGTVTNVSGTQITADFTIPTGATIGLWDVYVQHVDDGKNSTGVGLFDVQYPPPVVTGISPNSGNRGQTLTGVQIDGSDFRGPNANVIAQLKNGADTIDGTVTNVTDTQITADFTIPAGATIGLWDVYVQHVDDGKNDTLAGAFDVQYPPPVVTGISPNNGNRGQTLTGVQIDGSDFRGPDVNLQVELVGLSPTPIPFGNCHFVNATQITADLDIPLDAAVGAWDVCMTHLDDGKSGTGTGLFDVQYPPPAVTGINPDSGNRGQTLTGVAITGTNFRGPDVNIQLELVGLSPTPIAFGNCHFVNSTQITADLDIPLDAVVGLWDVRVTHIDDGKSGTGTGLFDIQYPPPTFTSINPNSAMNTGTVNVTDLKGTNFRVGASVHLERNGQ
ncbi:MAG: NosD domain-containing protein, partial [Actinomycetota bacterium]